MIMQRENSSTSWSMDQSIQKQGFAIRSSDYASCQVENNCYFFSFSEAVSRGTAVPLTKTNMCLSRKQNHVSHEKKEQTRSFPFREQNRAS